MPSPSQLKSLLGTMRRLAGAIAPGAGPIIAIIMLTASFQVTAARADARATHFKLVNGLEVVVIPDRRAPVITHMVWYRVGAADEPPGVSGIAHFLEHLMFKGTQKVAPGEFSKIIARQGGQDNAFTAHDVTAYHQRVAKDRLPLVMQMEADRMNGLTLDERNVLTERDVILEERRSRVENSPPAILDEQMSAALYLSHPYKIPVIGWEHEIAKLSREDALNFYKRHYAPNNAILVVAGDVTVAEVKKLAEDTYGKTEPAAGIAGRVRALEPPHRAPRRLELIDARAGNPTFSRYYLAPSYSTAAPGEAEALDLAMKVLGSGATSRIYKKVVVEQKLASSAGGYYSGTGLDYGRIGLYGVAAPGTTLDQVEQAIDKVVAEFIAGGVTEAELSLAKKVYLAEFIQESDSQQALARRYGWGLALGRSIKDIEDWPEQLKKVTAADVKRAAEKHLDLKRSVTGRLLPAPAAASATPAQPGARSSQPAAKGGAPAPAPAAAPAAPAKAPSRS